MVSKSLFPSQKRESVLNEAGGQAFNRPVAEVLAQYAATGCLRQTFYASAEEQLDTVLGILPEISPVLVAKTAVWTRENSRLRDLPVLLAAWLASKKDPVHRDLLSKVFPRVVNTGRAVRSFVQIIRSGKLGRKSFGSHAKRLLRNWFLDTPPLSLVNWSEGNDPSLRDVLRMVHPKPRHEGHRSLFAWLLGHDPKKYDGSHLPLEVMHLDALRGGFVTGIPDGINFQLLPHEKLSVADWRRVATKASYQVALRNLRTFERHGALTDEVVKDLALKLRTPPPTVFPHTLYMAWRMAEGLSDYLRAALEMALEQSFWSVPDLPPRTAVLVDVSGSMDDPVTGTEKGRTTKVTCRDVAGLMLAAILRRNPRALVLAFDTRLYQGEVPPDLPVARIAEALGTMGGGGTDISLPLRALNNTAGGWKGDLLVYISDQQSWVETAVGYSPFYPTAASAEWTLFKQRNPGAKMVCLDLRPYPTHQLKEDPDILRCGGFGDAVFDLMAHFVAGRLGGRGFLDQIEAVSL